MSVKNNKSVSSQALLEMDSIVSAIKEESKKTLNSLLTEAVKGALRESVEDDEEEKDYEVIDDDKKDADDNGKDDSEKDASTDVSEEGNDEMEAMPQDGQDAAMQAQPEAGAAEDPSMAAQEAPEDGAADEPAPAEGEGEEGWDDFSQYQVGDNTYDLTGENDYNNVVKIYKLLKDDDQVVVKKEGNTIQLQDGQAGTEYVIDLGGDGEEPKAAEEPIGGEGEPANGLDEGVNIAGFPDDDVNDEENLGVGDDLDFGLSDFSDDNFDSDNLEGGENNLTLENKKSRKPMKESKKVLFEVDLGYTDNYQDKDPIKGLSNSEPSKSGKSWHKGVPTGTEKPWAGPSKPKGDPFGKTVDEEEEKCCPKCGKCGDECTCGKEVEEQKNVGGFVQQNSVTASNIPNTNGRKARSQRSASQGVEVTGSADPRYGVKESKELKAIKAENRELKKAVIELRKNLNEAYITNVNLGKITKLFLENTTSKSEKVDIVNRFANEADTVEKSTALYESISRELKKSNNGTQMNLNETSQTANGTKELNENTYKSQEVLKTIDFMNRVLNC